MVLGDPETLEAQALDMLRQRQGVAQGLGRVAVIADRCQVEGGEFSLGECAHRAYLLVIRLRGRSNVPIPELDSGACSADSKGTELTRG